MAGTRESDKSTITTFTGTGLVRVVDDSAGTPASRNMTPANLAVKLEPGLTGIHQISKTGWYSVPAGGVTATAATLNSLTAIPLFVPPGGLSVDRIACQVTTLGAAGAVVRMGIYSSDAGGFPSALVVDAGTVATTTTGVKEATIAATLSAGVHWLVAVTQVVTASFYTTTTAVGHNMLATTAGTGLTYAIPGLYKTGVSGALADPIGTMTGGTGGPIRVVVRFV